MLARLALILLLPIAANVAAQQRHEGRLADATGLYRIEVPSGWQAGGRLIIYNHGLTMQQPEQVGFPSTAPSSEARAYWLAEGYGLAAGSYSTRNWALFDIEREQRALLAEFRRIAGAPGEILLVGGSLGGLVSMRTAESFHADGVDVAGVYALCPPLAGARSWDTALDTRLLFDAVCPSPLPTGSAHLPWVVDYDDIPSSINDIENIDDAEVVASILPAADRIRRCTGLFQPPILDTPDQLARRAQLKALLGVTSDDFLLTNLAYALYPMADLIQAPEKLDRANPFDNRFVDYGDAQLNAAILRVERDPVAAVKLCAQSDLSGRIGSARVLAIHTQRDELVIPEHLHVLEQIGIPDAQRATALVGEDAPAHCAFSGAEFLAGFESLRRWIDEDRKPTPASLRDVCEASGAQLGADQRCGFDPQLEIGSLDAKIRPRNLAMHQVSAYESGAWFDPATSGEGAIIEVLDGGTQAVVAWYSYPAPGEDGEQMWIIGVGKLTADGIHVPEARRYRGARFGAAFNPADVESSHWGELTFWSAGTSCVNGVPSGQAQLRYVGPDAFGRGERALQQLTLVGARCPATAQQPAPAAHPQSRFSGSWYRGPQAPGEGLQLQVDGSGNAVLIWYTFDPAGDAAWMVGTATAPAEGEPWRFAMQRPRGTEFGPGFDPARVVRHPWGEVLLRFEGCDRASLSWTSSEAGWVAGSVPLQRLTTPAGMAPCS